MELVDCFVTGNGCECSYGNGCSGCQHTTVVPSEVMATLCVSGINLLSKEDMILEDNQAW